jgi:hypothetical protein
MSRISKCPRCGGNIVEPAYPGDGAYPVAPMCSCGFDAPADRYARERSKRDDETRVEGDE